MIYSYIKRSQNRNQLRCSQTRLGTSMSVQSRNSSHKKYLEVYSKKHNQLDKSRAEQNLKESTMSLPIKFDQRGNNNSYQRNIQISKSQINLHPPSHHVITQSRNNIPINQFGNGFESRGHSLPTKTIIIRQIIKPIPVNFSYIQPINVRIESTPNPMSSYRMSLPVNMPNKCQIIRNQQTRVAAAPIRLFSNTSFYPPDMPKRQSSILSNIHNMPVHNSRSNTPQKRPVEKQEIANQNLIQSPLSFVSSNVSRQNMLSNQTYIDYQIKLRDIAVNTEAPSLKNSIIQVKYESGREPKCQSRIILSGKQKEQKSQYCSLIVTKQDEEGSLKQNLELKPKQCMCERIKNISQHQIKINKKQSLKPKKNFVFI